MAHPTLDGVARLDAWANGLTGLGSSKEASTRFVTSFLGATNYALFSALLTEDPIFGKIASARVKEAYRPGYTLEGGDAAKILQAASEIGCDEPEDPTIKGAFVEAGTLRRSHGGSAIVMCFDDGTALNVPVTKGAKVNRLIVVGANECAPDCTADTSLAYDDPEGKRVSGYRRTELYRVGSLYVHKSRVITFHGEYAPRAVRRSLQGWGVSSFVKPYEFVRRYITGLGALADLLADPAQAVYKIAGLWEMLTQNKEQALQRRMQLNDRQRSASKALLLDKESEDFQRIATPLAGISEGLDQLRSGVAMAAGGIPETELFGRSAAGMNATGEGERRQWYDSIDTERNEVDGPRLLRLYGTIAEGIGATPPIAIKWGKLYGLSAIETATLEKTEAETSTIYFDMGVVSASEVKAARATGTSLFAYADAEALAKRATEEGRTEGDPVDFGERPATDPATDPNADPSSDPSTGAPVNNRPNVVLTPSDNAQVVLVREAREAQGLAPFMGNLAQYNEMTVGEFAAINAARVEANIAKAYPELNAPPDAPKAPANGA